MAALVSPLRSTSEICSDLMAAESALSAAGYEAERAFDRGEPVPASALASAREAAEQIIRTIDSYGSAI